MNVNEIDYDSRQLNLADHEQTRDQETPHTKQDLTKAQKDDPTLVESIKKVIDPDRVFFYQV